MSIINDALKKVQANLDKKVPPPPKPQEPQNTTPSLPTEPSPPTPATYGVPETPKEEFIPAPLIQSSSEGHSVQNESIEVASGRDKTIVTLCFLICAILIGSILYLTSQFSNSRPAVSAHRAAAPQNPITAIQTSFIPAPATPRKETPKPRSSSDMDLNGIIMMDQGPVALINNEIYEAGAIIDGWEITNISLDQVDLKNSRTEETRELRVH
ncbi:MAG: hypothetical protein NUV91_07460 [Candidatus Omnitrophica bacterium]|nr:hypothetical protein [Candidatus Omnitrophota bacterium]